MKKPSRTEPEENLSTSFLYMGNQRPELSLGNLAKDKECSVLFSLPFHPAPFLLYLSALSPTRSHSLLCCREEMEVSEHPHLFLLNPPTGLEVLYFPTPLPSPSPTPAGRASLTAFYCSLEVQLPSRGLS